MRKTTKELLKEALYQRITDFSRLKKCELEKAIKNTNTKETNTGHEACETCLREQHMQRLIDEYLYTKKLLDNASLRKVITALCSNCGRDRVVIDVRYRSMWKLWNSAFSSSILIYRLCEPINHSKMEVVHTSWWHLHSR